MRVIEYLSLEESSVGDLTRSVNKAIGKGFQPLGGMSITTTISQFNSTSKYCCQAMVKYESVVENNSVVIKDE